jgi:two-component system, chemotaxis family, protein-glutamate methylesterase/glutaminase
VKQLGGTAIVQDPADAMFPSMPQNAIAHVNVDHVVPLAEVAPLLVRLTAGAAREPAAVAMPDRLEVEVKIANEEDPMEAGVERLGEPSKITCPQCHGVLLQLKEAGRLRFRCHTGHAYSADSLLLEIGESVENALWIALRVMQEGDLLMREMAQHMDGHAAPGAARLRAGAEEMIRKASVVRELVTAASDSSSAP